jgi:hypothetical protein
MADKPSDMVDVTIRIDKDKADRLDEIVRSLKAFGLDRVESHARFMIVNGCVSSDALDKLREVEGVESVRKDQTYRTQSS